jgi:glycosyltransferase involved in cell wall biosynthesis
VKQSALGRLAPEINSARAAESAQFLTRLDIRILGFASQSRRCSTLTTNRKALFRSSFEGIAQVESGTVRIAVIVPCYKVKRHILDVLARMPGYVDLVFCVDDACPEESGRFVAERVDDPRVKVLFRDVNGGVGAATCTGYRAALEAHATVCVKLDGDGQMDPALVEAIVAPVRAGVADYAKGNRFFNIEDVRAMPRARIIGNLGLSFFTKLSSGYWDVFDPTNGFTAVHARALERIPLDKVHPRFFFESDMLFRLGCLNARVVDVPMAAVYGEEVSNLKVGGAFLTFFGHNVRNFMKRVLYSYFLRDFSIASIYLVAFVFLTLLGGALGIYFWAHALSLDRPATPGQVMFAALPLVFGLQLGLAFTAYDIARTPRFAIHPYMPRSAGKS